MRNRAPRPALWRRVPRMRPGLLAFVGLSSVLFVAAAESDTLSPEAWRLWQELQPDAAFLEIANAGHMVPMERPDQVVDAVNKFLGTV